MNLLMNLHGLTEWCLPWIFCTFQSNYCVDENCCVCLSLAVWQRAGIQCVSPSIKVKLMMQKSTLLTNLINLHQQ